MNGGIKLAWRGRVRMDVCSRCGRILRRVPWSPNGLTQVAINRILNCAIKGLAQISTWYVGLIKDTDFEELSADDTMSSHAGWTECTDYSESTRVQWDPASATAGLLANSDALTFTLTANVTLVGMFLASNSTKGGTSGELFATALFDSNQSLLSGQIPKVFYEAELLGVG